MTVGYDKDVRVAMNLFSVKDISTSVKISSWEHILYVTMISKLKTVIGC